MGRQTIIPASQRARLRNLRSDCENSGPSEQADIIREARPLFAEATKAMGLPECVLKNNAEMECLLAEGAYETAALQLLSKGSAFVVSQGPKGACYASVLLPGDCQEKGAVGDSVALSVIGAEAAAILAATD